MKSRNKNSNRRTIRRKKSNRIKRSKTTFRSRKSFEAARKKGIYSKRCFLSNSNEYQICGKSGRKVSCKLLRSARAKALKNGHRSIAKKASNKLKAVCK